MTVTVDYLVSGHDGGVVADGMTVRQALKALRTRRKSLVCGEPDRGMCGHAMLTDGTELCWGLVQCPDGSMLLGQYEAHRVVWSGIDRRVTRRYGLVARGML